MNSADLRKLWGDAWELEQNARQTYRQAQEMRTRLAILMAQAEDAEEAASAGHRATDNPPVERSGG